VLPHEPDHFWRNTIRCKKVRADGGMIQKVWELQQLENPQPLAVEPG
jgi:hypothetical protein